MPDPRAHVALLIDFGNLRQGLKDAGVEVPAASALAAACLKYAGGVGRVTIARAYADWSRLGSDARDVQTARVVPVLVPATVAGEDRSHIRLTVDALEALFAGDEPDAFVLGTGDATLLPLVQALRGDGSEVVLIAPAASAAEDVRAEVDRFTSLEDVIGGAVGTPSAVREVREEDVEEAAPAYAAPPPPPRREPERRWEEPRRPAERGGWEPPPRGRDRDRDRGFRAPPAPPAPLDFTNYDWASFVKLIDELEHRLPFVGVRYLVNKVLGPRNCGIDDPRQKRDLINRAVDEGIIEMFPVGNLESRADPVTACRLDRQNAVVAAVLGANTATPQVPEAKDGDGSAGDEADEVDQPEGSVSADE